MENKKDNVSEEVIDLELYSKEGKAVPKGKQYKIKVDNRMFTVPESLSGHQILQLAEKSPVDRFQLNVKLRGGVVRKVGVNEIVSFTQPGLERFMTLPLDQTEG